MPRLTSRPDDLAPNGTAPSPAEQPPVDPAALSSRTVLLYSAADLCHVLRVSRATLDRLRAAGRLPRPVRLGGQWRWLREEIEAWTRAGCPPRTEWEARWAAENANGRR
jgi:predicted DNA-binding transcriptional regulator AlpA